MSKEALFCERYQLLRPLMAPLLGAIKKDLRNEHLKADLIFYRKYFNGKTPAKLTVEELVPGYSKEMIDEGNELLGEFVCNRWLLKHTELYDFFAEKLSKIHPDFDKITALDALQSKTLVNEALAEFDAVSVYLFAVLNSVALESETLIDLSKKALACQAEGCQAKQEAEAEQIGVKQAQERELEHARLVNRYEKKLAGLQKMYNDDVAVLKKQISALQRKLDSQCVAASK